MFLQQSAKCIGPILRTTYMPSTTEERDTVQSVDSMDTLQSIITPKNTQTAANSNHMDESHRVKAAQQDKVYTT